jgi:5-methylcytosine-specific restriction endonuclease McrA
MAKLYGKYEPGTYHSRELYRIVCKTGDLRPVWAYKNANKWGVENEPFLQLCKETCSCCGSELNYGLGKNNIEDKLDVNTPSTDHIVSRDEAKKLGWTEEQINDISNLWIVCVRCNRLKNNSTAEDIHRYKAIIEVLERTKSKGVLNG